MLPWINKREYILTLSTNCDSEKKGATVHGLLSSREQALRMRQWVCGGAALGYAGGSWDWRMRRTDCGTLKVLNNMCFSR